MTGTRLAPVAAAVALALALGTFTAHAQEPSPTTPPPTTPPTLPRPEPERPLAPVPTPEDTPEDAQEPDDDSAASPARRRGSGVSARVSGLVGFQSFSASESFTTVLGKSSGPVFGGGAGLLFGGNLFVDVMVSRFAADGTRVFVTDGGEVFDLGIATQVTVMPVDVSIGWRFAGRPRLGATGRPGFRAVPFAGGGFGFQRYKETSEFADAADEVDDTHGSYHVLGGVELPFTRRVGVTADVLYRWVPDAIGDGGVSAVYDETDLGGVQVRLKVTYTF